MRYFIEVLIVELSDLVLIDLLGLLLFLFQLRVFIGAVLIKVVLALAPSHDVLELFALLVAVGFAFLRTFWHTVENK